MDLLGHCARALNDEWAANPHHGAFWDDLEPAEQQRWREAAEVVLRTANYQGAVEARDELLDALSDLLDGDARNMDECRANAGRLLNRYLRGQ